MIRMADIYVPDKGTHLRLLSVASKIVDVDDGTRKQLVKAEKIPQDNEDSLYITFVLCHEGVNANKDEFVLAELRDNFQTIRYKDVNIEHTDKIIGCIYDAELVEDEANAKFTFAGGFKPHIVCSAVVYKFKFPEIAQEIIDRHDKGDLRFSMEVWFKEAQCSTCEGKFKATAEYCKHLNDRFTSGSSTSRRLLDITFGGAAVVQNPADKDARGLTVAVHNIDSMEARWIADGIGQSFDNLEMVLSEFFNNLKEDELVDQSVVQRRAVEIFNKFIDEVTEEDTSEATNKMGEVAMANKKYEYDSVDDIMQDEDVAKAIQSAVEAELAKRDEGKEIETLKDKIGSLEANLKAEKEEKEKIVADHAKEKEERELNELVDERFQELIEAGVKYDENRVDGVKSRLRKMDKSEYAEYKEDMLMSVSEEEDPEDEDEEDDEKKKKSESTEAKVPTVTYESSVASKSAKFEWETDLNAFRDGWKGSVVDDRQ